MCLALVDSPSGKMFVGVGDGHSLTTNRSTWGDKLWRIGNQIGQGILNSYIILGGKAVRDWNLTTDSFEGFDGMSADTETGTIDSEISSNTSQLSG